MEAPFQLLDGWLDAWCGDDRIGKEDPFFLLHKRQMGRLAYRWPDVILFLDFDGVMHPFNQTDLFCREESLARVLRDFSSVDVVISSSWREKHTLKNMLTFFLTDLRSRIVGVTPVIEIRDAVDVPGVRLREIKKYLVDTGNQHRRWVALDDAPELFPPRCAELVLCDGNHGFGEAQEQTLRARLQHKPEAPTIESTGATHPVTDLKGMWDKKRRVPLKK